MIPLRYFMRDISEKDKNQLLIVMFSGGRCREAEEIVRIELRDDLAKHLGGDMVAFVN